MYELLNLSKLWELWFFLKRLSHGCVDFRDLSTLDQLVRAIPASCMEAFLAEAHAEMGESLNLL